MVKTLTYITDSPNALFAVILTAIHCFESGIKFKSKRRLERYTVFFEVLPVFFWVIFNLHLLIVVTLSGVGKLFNLQKSLTAAKSSVYSKF